MNLVDDTREYNSPQSPLTTEARPGSVHHTQRESYMPNQRTDFGAGDFNSGSNTVTAYPTDTVYSDHSHTGSIDPATRPLINTLGSFGSSFGGDSTPFHAGSSSNAEGSRVAEMMHEGTESVVSGASDRKTAAGPAAPASEADVELGLPSYNEAIVSPVHRSPGANPVQAEQRMSSAVSTHSAHSAREMDIIGYRLALLERRLEESGGARPRPEASSPVIARPSAVLARPEPIAESPELAEPRVARPLPPAP